MCFNQNHQPRPTIVDPGQRASNAAADAVVARRKDAQGFSATLGNGFNANSAPSLGRQLLLGR
jgi:hypothetical protein